MTTLEHLKAARTRIANGWHQGAAFPDGMDPLDPHTPCCILGALNITDSLEREAARLLRSMLGERFLSRWNDAPERAQQEVLDLFDRAIASLAPAAR